MIHSLQPKGGELESSCVLFLPLFDSFNFIFIDVPRPLRNEIMDHSISKGSCVTSQMSQSVQNIFRDSRENIFPYYSQNIGLKIIHYTYCLNLSSVGKRLKKSMQQVLALRQSRYFFFKYLPLLKKYVKSTEIQFSHMERTANVLGEDPTKITITNASIDNK